MPTQANHSNFCSCPANSFEKISKMYTQFSLDFQKRLFKLARLTGYCPIIWNQRRSCFEVSFAGYLLTFWSFLMITSYILLLVPSNILLTHQKKEYQQFNYTIVVFLCALLGVLLEAVIVFRVDEVCMLLNGYYLYLRKFKGNHTIFSKNSKSRYVYARYIYICTNAFINVYIFQKIMLNESIRKAKKL